MFHMKVIVIYHHAIYNLHYTVRKKSANSVPIG